MKMASADREFQMINDQTGDVQLATLGTMPELQTRAYRLLDVNGYTTALAERTAEENAAQREAVPPLPDPNEGRVMADAILVSRRTFPGVKSDDPASSNIDPGEDTALTGVQRQATGAGATGVADDGELNTETATIQEMRDYGADNDIDMSGAKLRADYVAAIEEYRAARDSE